MNPDLLAPQTQRIWYSVVRYVRMGRDSSALCSTKFPFIVFFNLTHIHHPWKIKVNDQSDSVFYDPLFLLLRLLDFWIPIKQTHLPPFPIVSLAPACSTAPASLTVGSTSTSSSMTIVSTMHIVNKYTADLDTGGVSNRSGCHRHVR